MSFLIFGKLAIIQISLSFKIIFEINIESTSTNIPPPNSNWWFFKILCNYNFINYDVIIINLKYFHKKLLISGSRSKENLEFKFEFAISYKRPELTFRPLHGRMFHSEWSCTRVLYHDVCSYTNRKLEKMLSISEKNGISSSNDHFLVKLVGQNFLRIFSSVLCVLF